MGEIKRKKQKRKKIMTKTEEKKELEEKKEEILKDLLDNDFNSNARKAVDENDENWSTVAQEDMLDWIEEQGIYIRQ